MMAKRVQEHLAEQLNVDQITVSHRLKTMGKVIKVGRSVPHELTDRQLENRKLECEMLLACNKRVISPSAPNHRAKPTKDIVKALDWEPLAHAAYSPDLAPFD
ncbi:hypothetical protein TNCV_1496861 [Trichonephila clavipes]|nr:hypothetical protein TNCV_1496861 [Trichonephila clavipes]